MTHAVVFSFMSGVIHSYYAVAMAPAIAALAGGGLVELWRLRTRRSWGGVIVASALGLTAVVSWLLLERTPDFAPGLGLVVLVVVGLVAVIVAIPALAGRRRTQLLAAVLGFAVLLAGPTAYAFGTIGTAYSGGDPSAGPSAQGDGSGGPGGLGGAGGGPGDGMTSSGGGGWDGRGWAGGGASADSTLTDYLVANRGDATWIVAATSANEAGPIQLATGLPVMAMGGFTGSDPAPTLSELQAYVASGQLRFVLVGGSGGGNGGIPTGDGSDATASTRTAWVTSACAAVDYGTSGGGSALYDCAGALDAGG